VERLEEEVHRLQERQRKVDADYAGMLQVGLTS
jgi:hypothetical protein